MALAPEQVKELKNQLLAQVSKFPEAQREQARASIEAMSAEEIELMLKQQQEAGSKSGKQKGIFRMIVDKEIPSKIIEETELCIAVLDIKPLSRGHVILIPKVAKETIKDLSSALMIQAKQLGKKLTTKLKAQDALIQPEAKFGETIINIVPLYGQPLTLQSTRLDVTQKELEELATTLKMTSKKKVPVIKKKTARRAEILQKHRRVP